MIPNRAIISLARKSAQANEKAEPNKMCAVVYDGNKILGVGINKPYKTHPKAWNPYKKIHAEFDAILQTAWSGHDLDGASIYVHRVRRDGRDGLAKPCAFCERMLRWAGIREVHWSH